MLQTRWLVSSILCGCLFVASTATAAEFTLRDISTDTRHEGELIARLIAENIELLQQQRPELSSEAAEGLILSRWEAILQDSEKQQSLGLYMGHKFVGLMFLRIMSEDDSQIDERAEIQVLQIAADSKHQGFATRALEVAQSRLLAQGIQYLQVDIAAPNALARRFFDRHGFHIEEEYLTEGGVETYRYLKNLTDNSNLPASPMQQDDLSFTL